MEVPWCKTLAFAICIPLAFALTYARYLEEKMQTFPIDLIPDLYIRSYS